MANFEAGKLSEAESALRVTLALDEGFVDAHSLLGALLQQFGRLEEADRHLLRAIELAPRLGPPYFDYVQARKISEADRDMVDRMESVVVDRATPPRDRARIHYALGKALTDLGRYEEAMRNYDRANRLCLEAMEASGRKFSKLKGEDEFRRSAAMSSLWPKAKQGSMSEAPTLIVGMMRSGTTLVEQILSCHSQVGAAGEQPFWLDHSGVFHAEGRLPSSDEAKKLASEYLGLLGRFGRDALRITDKMPHNFQILGTFHAVFPKGRIVHCRRRLIDSCLSIYTTPFRSSPMFGHSQRNIVLFAREYEALMEHWRTVLPPDVFYEVRYEELVENPEREIRKLVEFLGLEWEDACLDPASNSRTVTTPSLWQARQPIYRTSVDRWRRFEPWLGELKELAEAS